MVPKITYRWVLGLMSSVMLLAIILSACQLPASQTPTVTSDQVEQQTQGAQTLEADLTSEAELAVPATQTAAALGPTQTQPATATQAEAKPPTFTPTEPSAAESTPTAEPSTATAIPATATPTTAAPTATPTLAVATLSAISDTNCRQGPGGNYIWISGLLAGKTAAVFGKDSSETWWYIERPGGKVDEYCWVWGDTTQVDIDVDLLPVIPPYPPQLDPAVSQWYFTIDAVNIHTCTVPTAFIMLDNLGQTTFQSARVETRNVSTNKVLDDTSSNAPFTSSDRDCFGGFSAFPPGEFAYVLGGLSSSLTGDMIVANVTLCKDDNLKGPCYYDSVTFVMP